MPHDYEHKDYWTYKVRGGLLPGWVKRAAKGKRDFWREWDFDAEELTSRDSYAMAKKRGDGDRASGISISGGVGAMPVLDTVITGDRNWEPGNPHYSMDLNHEDEMGDLGYGSSSRR